MADHEAKRSHSENPRGNRSGQGRNRDSYQRRDDDRPRRDGDRREGGYQRREGGYQRRDDDRPRRDGDRREGGYQRREGGYQRRDDDRPRRDGDRREGGYQRRDERPKQGVNSGPKRTGRDKPHSREYKSQDPNEPMIPAGVMAGDLDKEAAKALDTLSGANREIVARHLVMAGQVVDFDPDLAYKHAQAAVKRAGRIDVVREAAALTAYATGRYEEALREVRAVRRMRGDDALRAIEADSERGLGRPEKAVQIVEETDISTLELEEQVELILVSAGARVDLEQTDVGLLIVEEALHKLPEDSDPFLIGRLQSLRADILRLLGRDEEADEAEALIPEVEDEIEIVDLAAMLDADVDHTSTPVRGSRGTLLDKYDTLVLDLDGVCFEGTSPIDHVSEVLTKAYEQGVNLTYATNNASRTPEQVVEKLAGFDIPADAQNILTSAIDVTFLLKAELEPGDAILVIGAEALVHEVEKAGFKAVFEATDEVKAVVQGFSANVGWQILSEAAYAINAGARYYATNLDSTLPTERGMALGNGSLVAAVTRATGRRPAATGKPNPQIMQRAAATASAEAPLAVGDRLETDTAAAIAARIPTMHVLTGVSSAKDVVLAKKGFRPTFLALDLRGLYENHPQPKHHRDGTWSAGTSQPIRLTRWGNPVFNDIELRDDGDPVRITLDNYRALAAAVWEQIDIERPTRIPELIVVENDDPEGIVTKPNFVRNEEGFAVIGGRGSSPEEQS